MSYDNFPLISDLINSYSVKKKHNTYKAKCKCVENQRLIDISTTKFKPDHRLLNWEKWMEERKRIKEKLKQNLNRNSEELLINSFEHVRTVKEEKLVLEYTKIPVPDRYRGCPEFFKVPESLANKCNENEGTEYFIQPTKEQKCEIPKIEYVIVPYEVREEKHVPRKTCTGTAWKRSEYRQEVLGRKKATKELQFVQPHKPEGEEIIVHCLNRHNENQTTCNTKFIYSSNNTNETLNEQIFIEDVRALRVDNFELRPDDVAIRKLVIPFNYDLSNQEVLTKTIKFFNVGTVTLRFQLHHVKICSIFRDILPERKPENVFYFNKNEDVILPGQTVDFRIWFQTNKHGKYLETWQLVTKPPVISNSSRFLIVLQAHSEYGNLSTKVKLIDEQLNNRIKNRLEIKEKLISNEFKNSDFLNPVLPRAYIFESVNSDFKPGKTKINYVYNEEIVDAMENLYLKLKKPNDPDKWNFHIKELEKLARERDQQEFYEEYGKITNAISSNQITKIESAIKTQSKDKVKLKNINLDPNKKKKTFVEELQNLIIKCSEPFVRLNVQQKKYQLAYKLLSVHIDRMCESIETLEINLNLKPSHKKHISKIMECPNPERLFETTKGDYENYKPMYDRKDLFVNSIQATDCLKEIPKENVEERFNLYRCQVLGICPEVKEDISKKRKKDKKNKKKNKEKKGKKGLKNKSATKSTEIVIKQDYSCPKFNPHAKSFCSYERLAESFEKETETLEADANKTNNMIIPHYRYNLYVIIYNELENAIMEITEMIDNFNKPVLGHSIIKKVDKYHTLSGIKSLTDLEKAITENRIKDIVAERDNKIRSTFIQVENSDTSIWTVLDNYTNNEKLTKNIKSSKPISFPAYNYEELKFNKHPKTAKTETVDGIVDANWQKGWPKSCQKDNPMGDPEINLEEYIELFGWKTSAQSLMINDENEDKIEKFSEEKFFID